MNTYYRNKILYLEILYIKLINNSVTLLEINNCVYIPIKSLPTDFIKGILEDSDKYISDNKPIVLKGKIDSIWRDDERIGFVPKDWLNLGYDKMKNINVVLILESIKIKKKILLLEDLKIKLSMETIEFYNLDNVANST